MIRSGASLNEIGQVLRHQEPDTARIYAKVDVAGLRSLSLAWPGRRSMTDLSLTPWLAT